MWFTNYRKKVFISSVITLCFSTFLVTKQQDIGYENRTTAALGGCEVRTIEDGDGYSVFCSKLYAPGSAILLSDQTRRLSINDMFSLRTDVPLTEHLGLLEVLDLSNNKLSNVTRYMLQGLTNLRELGLSKNRLTNFPADVFVGNSLLEVIDLSSNSITFLENITHCMSHLQRLKVLKLTDNLLLEIITVHSFYALLNVPLKVLLLSGCHLHRIDDDAFQALRNLTHLDMSFNPMVQISVLNLTKGLQASGAVETLKSIKLNELSGIWYFPLSFLIAFNATGIEVLELRKSDTAAFPASIFFYPQLRKLDMSSWGISNIQGSNFINMPKIEILLMTKHELQLIKRESFPLSNLKILDISEFQSIDIKSIVIENFAFRNLKQLEVLRMNSLLIKHPIRRYTFHGLENLRELSLYRGILHEIEDFSFETLGNLLTLDISFNSIMELTNNSFYGLHKARTIILRGNGITFLHSCYPFHHTPALMSIDLSENKIIKLPVEFFAGLEHLGLISLRKNAMIPWTEQLLPRNDNETAVAISYNMITHFTTAMLDDVRNLSVLDFQSNPLNCSSCSFPFLQTWIRNTSVKIEKGNAVSMYSCRYPETLRGKFIFDVDVQNDHCLPFEVNILLLACSTVTGIACTILFSCFVWYKWRWNIRYCCLQVKLKVWKYKMNTREGDYVYDAFVSYNESDVKWIREEMEPAMEANENGLLLCLADRNFDATRDVTENVIRSIQFSRTTIIVLSNCYMESNWCMFDVEMAQHKLFEDTRSGLILILLEEIDKSKVTKNFKYVLKTRTVIPWTDNPIGQKLFWQRLRLAIAKPEQKELLKHIT